MSNDSSYRAWLVDLDGTLYYPLPVRLAMGLELLLLGRGAISTIRAFRKQHEQLRRAPESVTQDPFASQLMRTALQLQLPEGEVLAQVTEWMQHRPGKWLHVFKRRSLLREIAAYRTTGGRTAVVSDYPAGEKLAALGIGSLFDAVIASGEPGGPRRLKPDPEGYLLAARALQVEPAQCLVLGDRRDADEVAAREAGMGFRLVG